jgi:hypothetical protein
MNIHQELGTLQSLMETAYKILEDVEMEEGTYVKFKYNAWKEQVEEYAKEVDYEL